MEEAPPRGSRVDLLACVYPPSRSRSSAFLSPFIALLVALLPHTRSVTSPDMAAAATSSSQLVPAPPICETDLTSTPSPQQHVVGQAGSSLLQQGLLRQPPPTAAAETEESETTRRGQKRLEKQSLGYVVRSGIAGGVAGCVVRLLRLRLGSYRSLAPSSRTDAHIPRRPRRPSHRSIESRFSFRRRIPSFKSTADAGSAFLPPAPVSLQRREPQRCSRVTRQRCCASFPTPPSSTWPTISCTL